MYFNKNLYFDNLYEFLNYAIQDSNAKIKSSRRTEEKLKWSGGLLWEEAKQMAFNGWREGMKEIEKYRAKIVPVICDRVLRPQNIYSVTGYNVDVGSFMANDPECFMTREYEQRNYPGKICKIVVSISYDHTFLPEEIIHRGAMICALIDAIEFAGHRAEVICNCAATCSGGCEDTDLIKGGRFEVSVNIKKASQALEMSDLAFCLAHPAMLRRIMFSVEELEGWSDIIHTYDTPDDATDKGDLYIAGTYYDIDSDDYAIKWVFSELDKLGIKIESV